VEEKALAAPATAPAPAAPPVIPPEGGRTAAAAAAEAPGSLGGDMRRPKPSAYLKNGSLAAETSTAPAPKVRRKACGGDCGGWYEEELPTEGADAVGVVRLGACGRTSLKQTPAANRLLSVK